LPLFSRAPQLMTERFAIYFAPAPASDLRQLAVQWLGRDEITGAAVSANVPGLDPELRRKVTESARRYGFHATLKAPIALTAARNRADLEQAMAAFAVEQRPVAAGRIVLRDIDGFLALVPAVQSEALTAFAGDCVVAFDTFRAPPAAQEREKRIASGLTARQVDLLDQFGYPYVMEQFQFHMTVTDRLSREDAGPVAAAAQRWFAPVIGSEIMLDRLALFHEIEPGAPFLRLADFPLTSEWAH
jgi:putative phosphonate metabolism protein